jgi:predicted ribosome-associated RNA-binding protein Tma20
MLLDAGANINERDANDITPLIISITNNHPDVARFLIDRGAVVLVTRGQQHFFIGAMRAIQPQGPYNLGGFCFGGEVAFEMAQQLRAQGQTASLVGIIYAYLPGSIRSAPGFTQKIRYHINNFFEQKPEERMAYLAERSRNLVEQVSRKFAPTVTRRLTQTLQNTTGYFPMYYPGKIMLFQPDRSNFFHLPSASLRRYRFSRTVTALGLKAGWRSIGMTRAALGFMGASEGRNNIMLGRAGMIPQDIVGASRGFLTPRPGRDCGPSLTPVGRGWYNRATYPWCFLLLRTCPWGGGP